MADMYGLRPGDWAESFFRARDYKRGRAESDEDRRWKRMFQMQQEKEQQRQWQAMFGLKKQEFERGETTADEDALDALANAPDVASYRRLFRRLMIDPDVSNQTKQDAYEDARQEILNPTYDWGQGEQKIANLKAFNAEVTSYAQKLRTPEQKEKWRAQRAQTQQPATTGFPQVTPMKSTLPASLPITQQTIPEFGGTLANQIGNRAMGVGRTMMDVPTGIGDGVNRYFEQRPIGGIGRDISQGISGMGDSYTNWLLRMLGRGRGAPRRQPSTSQTQQRFPNLLMSY